MARRRVSPAEASPLRMADAAGGGGRGPGCELFARLDPPRGLAGPKRLDESARHGEVGSVRLGARFETEGGFRRRSGRHPRVPASRRARSRSPRPRSRRRSPRAPRAPDPRGRSRERGRRPRCRGARSPGRATGGPWLLRTVCPRRPVHTGAPLESSRTSRARRRGTPDDPACSAAARRAETAPAPPRGRVRTGRRRPETGARAAPPRDRRAGPRSDRSGATRPASPPDRCRCTGRRCRSRPGRPADADSRGAARGARERAPEGTRSPAQTR